jgi:hypothetical protein
MTLRVIIAIASLTSIAKADPVQNLYKRITELNSVICKKTALELSELLVKYSKKHNTDPNVSVAIAMQETGITNKNRMEKGKVTDVGMFQFHIDTIKYYKLDKVRLMNDLEYAVKSHTKLLRIKIDQCRNILKVKNKAWSCYHSFTESHREKYITAVGRYL